MSKKVIGIIEYDAKLNRLFWNVGNHNTTARVDITEVVKAFCGVVEETTSKAMEKIACQIEKVAYQKGYEDGKKNFVSEGIENILHPDEDKDEY